MVKRTLTLTVFLGFLLTAQGPISDVLTVTFPQKTRVGEHQLAPGEYEIRQLPTASSPRLLEFVSGNGTRIETSITAVAALDNNNTKDTSVVLENRGGEQVLRYVWIGGKSYGYEIPASGTVDGSTQRSTMRLTATYTAAEPQIVAQTPPTPRTEPEPASAPAPAAEPKPEPATAPATAPEPAPAPAPAAQASPEPTPSPTPTPTPAPEPQQTAEQQPAPQSQERLPATASNWAVWGLAGILMMSLGLYLLRKPINS